MAKGQKQRTGTPPAATNRKAFRQYVILEKLEAGIELLGTEVKSIRARNADLSAAFARVEQGQVILYDLHIKPYEFGHQFNHEPRRPRRLLLHKHEIERLFGKTAIRGHTLVPLALYFKRGRVKVELALCQGRHFADKRDLLRRQTAEREMRRAIIAHSRR